MASLPPNDEEDPWSIRGGKRSWGDVQVRENESEDEQGLRRTRSEEEPEEPCTKMARLPVSSTSPSPPSLSSSWPGLTSTVAASKSESALAEPTVKESAQSLMTEGLSTDGGSGTGETTTQDESSQALPYAPRLTDYCAPGGTTRYLPRPEWIATVGRKRPRSAAAAVSHRKERDSRASSPPPPPAPVQENEQNDNDNNAPNDGLLPDHLFGAWSSPQRSRRRTSNAAIIQNAGDPSLPEEAETDAGPTNGPVPNDATKNESTTTVPPTNGATETEVETPVATATFGKDYDTALHIAIREGASDAALDLLAKGASVHVENIKGVTPLVLASQKGNLSVVRDLLRRGASPLAASLTGCTSLLQASHFGHGDVVNLLLKHGARMELANYKNTTALMRASQEGHDGVVDTLLRHGAMVNRRNNEQMSALMLASQRGHATVVKKLVDARAEVNAMTAQDSTSLMLACKRGHIGVVRELVTAGCELQLRDARGRTARDMAQRKSDKAMLQLLTPTMQVELMRRESRVQRNHEMIQMWLLLQQERALVPVPNEDVSVVPTMMTIHELCDHRDRQVLLSRMYKSISVLVQAMMLPAPLLEHIATYMPMPRLWDRRIGLITKRCGIDADSSVSCALDLIDEVLEDGGFVEACDVAGVTPPPHFKDWGEWKSWGKRFDGVNNIASLEDAANTRPSVTNNSIPALRAFDSITTTQAPPSRSIGHNNHTNPQQGSSEATATGMTSNANDRPQKSSVQMRREVCFLQLLAYRSPLLTRTLASPPYNMPPLLVQQLKNVNDIQSLVRRMGSRGIHFDVNVGIELVLLAGTVSLWYTRERDEE